MNMSFQVFLVEGEARVGKVPGTGPARCQVIELDRALRLLAALDPLAWRSPELRAYARGNPLPPARGA
jgi:hypothetical protein